MTATAYTDAVKEFNAANGAWNDHVQGVITSDPKVLLDALIKAAAKCVGTCPIARDRLWYEKKHMLAIECRAKCA